jgi:hypothetical protein
MIGTRSEEGSASREGRNNGLAVNTEVAFAFPEFKDQVDLIIHEGLNDMWLLLTGEEIKGGFRLPERRDGRAIGILWDGQVHMLTSKPSALETLRVLGIEMF